jgi:hypothetical protein
MSLDRTSEDCLCIIFNLLRWEELLELRLVNKYVKVMVDVYLLKKYKKGNIIDAIKALCTAINEDNTIYLYKNKYHNDNGPAVTVKINDDIHRSYFKYGNPVNVMIPIVPKYHEYMKNGVQTIVSTIDGSIVHIKVVINSSLIIWTFLGYDIPLMFSYIKDEKSHNDTDAAEILYHTNGNLQMYTYRQNGFEHRIDGPSSERFNFDEKIVERKYCYNGMEHNDNGPSYIKWYSDGVKYTIRYCKNGKRHRIGKPAEYYFSPDGELSAVYYYYEGQLHNEDGPAIVVWYPDHSKKISEYYIHGKPQDSPN